MNLTDQQRDRLTQMSSGQIRSGEATQRPVDRDVAFLAELLLDCSERPANECPETNRDSEPSDEQTPHIIVCCNNRGDEAMYVHGVLVPPRGPTVFAVDIAKAAAGLTVNVYHMRVDYTSVDWPASYYDIPCSSIRQNAP